VQISDFIFILFIITYIFIFPYIYYSNFWIIKSFGEWNQILSSEPKRYKKSINRLAKDLNNKTNIEFAIYYSKLGNKISLFSFILINVILILNIISANNLGFSLSKTYFSFFLSMVALFIPDFYICVIKYCDIFDNFTQRVLRKMTYYLLSFTVFMILFYIFIILPNINPHLDDKFSLNVLYLDTVKSIVNITVYSNANPLESISGNKLSFSGILFTLGIGGTIILSLFKNYKEQEIKINNNVLEIKKYYLTWFKSNKNNFNTYSNYDKFNTAINNLREKFDDDYLKMRIGNTIYDFTKLLMFSFYIAGIGVFLGSDGINSIIFKSFPLVAFIYIILIYYLFMHFNHFIYDKNDNPNAVVGEKTED
jgi:hypothetical protein